jgi:hypothetical protein
MGEAVWYGNGERLLLVQLGESYLEAPRPRRQRRRTVAGSWRLPCSGGNQAPGMAVPLRGFQAASLNG